MEKIEAIKPFVGMPCTYCIGSDEYAREIDEVSENGNYVMVVNKFNLNPKKFTLRKDGKYRPVGGKTGKTGYLHLGEANDYLDPSF